MTNYIDKIIDFAWASGADVDFVNEAKKELKNIREKIDNFKVVAWAKTNNFGDLYDLRLFFNPYDNKTGKVELYRKIS